MKKSTFLLIFSGYFLSCCGFSTEPVNWQGKKTEKDHPEEFSVPDSVVKPLRDTVFFMQRNQDSISVTVKVPRKITGVLLVLHGWNLKPDELCLKTTLCRQALDSGYVLILPDFGKTTYQWQNYPQTKKAYLKYPTRSWMQDTFLIQLQNEFNLLLPGHRNFVYGVSTGGRGAALLALENPDVFKAAACLSADFDHSKLGNEPINNGYYGSIKSFPERWTGKDNIYNRAAEFTVGLFLAHGVKDKICPVSQTQTFSDHILEVNSGIKVITDIDPLGDHTYSWWDKKTTAVIEFFSGY